MAARHYDVIVLGRSIGALLGAALLARREFRVLVLGQGQPSPHYRALGYQLGRRSFSLLGATSPVFRRALQELAQTQRFRRLTSPLDPMFGYLEDALRFEVPPDVELFSREIEREMPEVVGPVAELYSLISDANLAMDRAFDRELVWPPGTIFERLETAQRASLLPYKADQAKSALFERFPTDHPMRRIVSLPALFSSHVGKNEDELSLLGLARLHGFWTRGVHALPRGEMELEEFLVERIEAHGGVCRLNAKASEILVERGRVVGVREEDDHERSGADAIVCALTGEEVAELSHGEGLTKQAERSWPALSVDSTRFVLSVVVRKRGIPAALPQESFLASNDPGHPSIHLQSYDMDALLGVRDTPESEKTVLLLLEAILETGGGIRLERAREALLGTLERYLPFVSAHYLAIDSVYDGRPALYFENNASGERLAREMDRIHLKETSPMKEPMQPRFRPIEGYVGLSAEPVRGPIPGSYLLGPSVLPALGQEGELLAAQSVARILTKRDRERQKLRKRLWTKIETS